MRRRYILTYDICDPKRLRMTFKVARAYGDHLQLSVFECLMNEMERISLEDDLKEVMNQEEDQVLLIDLGWADGESSCRIVAWGRSYQPAEAGPVVV